MKYFLHATDASGMYIQIHSGPLRVNGLTSIDLSLGMLLDDRCKAATSPSCIEILEI